jgi:endonuclease/exonuclease/phosphatase (EEP) superfamily protein YafD
MDLVRARFPGYHVAVKGEFLTLSRFPIVRTKALHARGLPPDRSPWHDFWSVKTLRTDLKIGERVLSVYNVHIQTPIGTNRNILGRTFHRQLKEQYTRRKAQFRALTDDIESNPLPTLVAGDFNSTSAMGDMRGIRSLLTDATPTQRSLYPVSFPVTGIIPRLWRLDWVFTDSGVKVHRYAFRGSEGLSDHKAQSLLVSLPDRTGAE